MLTTLKHHTLLIVLLAILSAGCSPLVVPSAYQVPNVKEQGDVNLTVVTGVSALNVQAAVVPVKHLLLTSAYSNNIHHTLKGNIYNHTTFGIGYLTSPAKVQFGTLFIYGFGKSRDNSIDENEGNKIYHHTGVKYKDYQLQPYMNVKAGEHIDFYTGVRSSFIDTYAYDSNETSRKNPGNMFTAEPFLGMRLGFENLKIDYQFGIYKHKRTYVSSVSGDALLNMHIGLTYTVNWKKVFKL
ncbi:hypothetical protein GCM10023149_12990 [Mucilaginibacter gynuensis]|uniref:Outer membrane protein beta-barrel domain-containing protein n=1 Tax=Mucilaginibacter gynuensis TaxID=1302236 RepID=A0ABP8G2Q3_9SPHI